MIFFLITSASGIDRFWVGHQRSGIQREDSYIFGFKYKNLGNLDGKKLINTHHVIRSKSNRLVIKVPSAFIPDSRLLTQTQL